jgi:glycosyltransferase involved in cell wall biosynthesis
MVDDFLLVIVPAYNEEKSLLKTIDDIRLHLPESFVLVIDDGSTDETPKLCQDLGVMVLTLPFNCGIGAALKTGLTYGVKNEFKAMLIFDGDGQHSAVEAQKLISKVDENNIVIGYRKYDEYSFSFFKKFAHKLLVLLLKIRSGIKTSDPTSGFRVFSYSAAKTLTPFIESEYLADTVGILQLATTLEIKILEVPVLMKSRTEGVPSNRGYKLAKRFILTFMLVLFGRRKK